MSLAAADLELKGPKKNTLPSMSGSNDFLDFVEEQKIAF